MTKVLVTGVNGFVGRHLVKELEENDIDVLGIGGPLTHDEQVSRPDSYMELDLSIPEEASRIDFKGIDTVIHLAGLAAVGPSFDNPRLYMDVNLGIEINLFETALKQKSKCRLLIVSSGTLYDPKAPLPLTEESPVVPNSPYAVSKIGQEQMAHYYNTRGFECIIARPFNHIGPGQGSGFIVPDLGKQIVNLDYKNTNEILVGNLDAKRDYTDVRDIVRAYRLIAERGQAGETYNICSGIARSGHEILSGLLKAAGCSPAIKQDPAKLRPSDTLELRGSHDKISRDTGWKPEISLDNTLSDVIQELRLKN